MLPACEVRNCGMKKIITLFLFFCAVQTVGAQYYFRGDVKNIRNEALTYVRIHIHSTNSFFYTGPEGSFGIPSSIPADTVTFEVEGYESKTLFLSSDAYEHILLRSTLIESRQKKQLLSFTKDKFVDKNLSVSAAGETYTHLHENEFNLAAQYPTTGFALNVDKASYSNIRRFITIKSIVPKDAVRIEEMLNYFPQQPMEIPQGKTFQVQSQITDCPWAPSNKLLFIRLQAKKVNYDFLPPSNFVFLIDVSGSMDMPNRLPLLKSAFRMMVQNLRPVDTVSIVLYGGTVGVALPPTSGAYQQKILNVIDSLEAGGDTPGESAIRQAYKLAQRTFIKGGNNRIILATDGDFNVGEVSEEALMELVMQKQQSGIYLTCLGVGMGNYKDSKLELLAKSGNGNFAYLDNVMEAEKVLVKELMQTLYAVANDALINVTFRPDYVKEYRLIGYENKKGWLADSNYTIQGGEIGTGHTITAVFELVPQLNPFKEDGGTLADVELNYIPTDTKDTLRDQFPILNHYKSISEVDSSFRFAAGIAMFGLILRESSFLLPQYSWEQLIGLLNSCVDPKDYWQKEMLSLVQRAKELYQPSKKNLFNFRKKKEGP